MVQRDTLTSCRILPLERQADAAGLRQEERNPDGKREAMEPRINADARRLKTRQGRHFLVRVHRRSSAARQIGIDCFSQRSFCGFCAFSRQGMMATKNARDTKKLWAGFAAEPYSSRLRFAVRQFWLPATLRRVDEAVFVNVASGFRRRDSHRRFDGLSPPGV